jgi:hypothetical protein
MQLQQMVRRERWQMVGNVTYNSVLRPSVPAGLSEEVKTYLSLKEKKTENACS